MSDPADLLSRFSRNWAEALEGIVQSTGGRVLRKTDTVATDVGRPAGLMNSVVLLEPLQDAVVASLMASLETFFAFGSAKQAGTVFLFSASPVPELTSYGWEYVEQMPLLLRLPGGQAPMAPADLTITEVQTDADLRHFEHIMIYGFPVPELEGLPPGSAFGPALLQDDRIRFWLGWHEGLPVSASAAYTAFGIVNLIFLATLRNVRRRGFGAAVAWHATLMDPKLPAMLIASEDARSMYTRMGYQHVRDMPLWTRERP